MELTPPNLPKEAARDWMLVFALPDEARPFLARWEQCVGQRPVRADPPGLPRAMARWQCGSTEVWACGMGPRNAARWAAVGLDGKQPRRLVTAGFAGALDPSLALGEVLVAADPGYPAVQGARLARFHCSEVIATTAADKTLLRARTGADAVEMESGVIREACRQRGIPSATIRVVSDIASEDLPLDFGSLMTRDDRLHFGKLAWRIARSPGLVRGLMRLQRNTQLAGGNLAEVLVRHLAAD
ncbi:MAG: hypothetical protein DVB31_09920 [Verrucomicrobia bacterium]|nr:MAG: hypothetical protein DVB31_09920 [Verrucomicrobiota bacterium]